MKKSQVAFILLVIIFLFFPLSAFSEIVLIANKNVEENSLSKEEVKNIFLGNKKKWSNNNMIQFVIQKKGPVHKDFLKAHIGRSEQQYRMTLRQMVFLGKGNLPKECNSDKEMIEYVAKTDNAIGYVESNSVNDTVKKMAVK